MGGKALKFSNLEKVLYPETGFTKGQMLAYYARIAPFLLPHLKGRALTLKRYPDGVAAGFFYEKNCPKHRPPWVKTRNIATEGRPGGIDYCTIDSLPGLLWVANLGTIELHTSLALAKRVDRPTMMVLDLDPGAPAGLLDAVRIAMALREALKVLGLMSVPKVSGGKGVHVHVPLNTAVTYAETKVLAHGLAKLMERQHAGRVTATMRKAERAGKVFIDWSQNDGHKTTACVYTMRAQSRPTVAAPVGWEELGTALRRGRESGLVFSPEEAVARAERADLAAVLITEKQAVPEALVG